MEKSLFEQMGGTYTQVGDYLNDYLVDIENQAENMFLQLVNQLAKSEDITEELKAKDQMEWVAQMNNVCNSAREIVNSKFHF